MAINNFDTAKAEQQINELLCGTYFYGYSFNTSFVLEFSRSFSESVSALPVTLKLYLPGGDFWFQSKEEWNGKLSLFNSQNDADLWKVEEPLQAFELTRLRWSENSEVSSVLLTDGTLAIMFKNGWELNISCAPVEGPAWILEGYSQNDENSNCTITCENGEIKR